MILKNIASNIVFKIIFVFFLFSSQIKAQNKILNNGNRRVGSGAENSINAAGNMQQPFYYNGSTWQQLTYSNLPLDIRWGVGGDGTNSWNNNGSFQENAALTNIAYDYSGFTSATVARGEAGGTGTIKVSGNISVNSQTFLVENWYTLGMTDGFIRVKTKITNQSASNATNVRLWVGTRDDFVGGTDQPTKERGNLVNGVFTMITNPATQAKAVKVRTSSEAIMMFSNSPRAQTSIRQYESSNFTVTAVDPATSPITLTNDGQYVVYARFNDLAPNQSDELDWYYAAGTLAEITEIIRQVAEAASSVQNITYNSADYSYSATQSGTTSYVLVPSGSTVPTAAQIEAGVNYTGGTVISSSSIASTANQAHIYNFTGLTPNTGYTVYAVTKYNDGVNNVFTSVQTTNFTTLLQTPTITNFNNISKLRNDVPFTITAPTSNSAGAFTYTSSNTAVATISGTTITIVGVGTTTITANQAANGYFSSGSTTATLTVSYNPPIFNLQPSTISQIMCAGSSSLSVVADGGGDFISNYKWYRNSTQTNTGGTLVATNTSTATTDSFSPTDAGPYYYYVTCTTASGNSVTSEASGAITVNAVPVISSQPSASTQSICINGTATALSVTASAGSGALYRYKWFSNTTASTTGGTLEATTFSTATTNTFTPDTTIPGTKYYYVEVTNSNGCFTKSNVSGAITISPLSVAGIASSTNLFLASGGQPTLSLTGSTGSIVWQKSSDGLTGWTSATGTGATTQTFTSSAVAATTYFRAMVTSGGCSTEYSNVVKITITTTPITTTGIVTSVCYSTSAQTTTLPYTAAAGSPNSYSIDWDYAANSAGLADQDATSYTFVSGGGTVSGIIVPAGLNIGFYSGVMTVTNGTGSSSFDIKLAIGSIAGSISGGTSVTIGSNSTVLTLSGYSGSIVWQSSTDNATFTTISGATATNYTATNLTSSTFYRVLVTNGSCGTVTSATATITVMPNSNTFGVYGTSATNTMNNNVATVVDNAIVVNSNGAIDGFTVTITSDYTDGDVLSFTGPLPAGITASSFNTTSRSLTFTGSTSAANWQALLRTVTLKSTSSCYPTNRKVSFLPSSKFFNLFNGHYYEYVPTLQSWTSAKAAAAAKTYYGRQGYLVTVSSQAENSYINTLIGQNTWIGATDNYTQINASVGYTKYSTQMASEGNYHWVTGPEKGTQMRNGNALNNVLKPGNNIAGVYNNWAAGEPNEWPFNQIPGDEDYGHLYTGAGQWNDYDNGKMFASIVEYGGLSTDDISDNITFTRNIIINGSPVGTIAGAAPVCAGTNSTTLTYSGGGTIVRWEYSLDNFLTAGTAVNTTASYITVNNISTPRYYRVVVNTSGCTGLSSSIAFIDVNSTVAGNISSNNSTICSGANAMLTLNGNSGSILKWQYSTASDFLSNVNDINVTTGDVSQVLYTVGTYYFRAVVQNSSCGGSVSSEGYPVTVITGVNPVGGTVNNVTYCGGSNSGTMTLTGASGTSYQWEVSTDGYGVVWTNAPSTNTTLSYTGISATTRYRVKVTSGSCGYTYSSVGTIAVNNSFAAGTISGATTVNSFTNSTTLTLGDYVGTIQWQSSTDGSNYSNIAGATNPTYTATNLTTSTFFRTLVKNGSCDAAASNPAKITVSITIVPATLTNFRNETRTVFDRNYIITMPTSNNKSGLFTYTSSNPSVATISGSTVTIVGPGTTTITANQGDNALYSRTTISATLTVPSIIILNKYGQLSNMNLNYVSKNGALSKLYGISPNGTIKSAKTIVSLGDVYQGGIITYILGPNDPGYDPEVQHGLIVSFSDQSYGIQWNNGLDVSTSATGTAIGTGLSNSNAVITTQGGTSTNYAAGLARAYTGGGFNDWYLPSIEELKKVYANKTTVDTVALANGGNAFSLGEYWSSTEISSSLGRSNNFSTGIVSSINKSSQVAVRAVRSF